MFVLDYGIRIQLYSLRTSIKLFCSYTHLTPKNNIQYDKSIIKKKTCQNKHYKTIYYV